MAMTRMMGKQGERVHKSNHIVMQGFYEFTFVPLIVTPQGRRDKPHVY